MHDSLLSALITPDGAELEDTEDKKRLAPRKQLSVVRLPKLKLDRTPFRFFAASPVYHDPEKPLDKSTSIEKIEDFFSITIINCPKHIQRHLSPRRIKSNNLKILGNESETEQLLEVMHKKLGVISATRRLQLLCELKMQSGSIKCALIDNENIELIPDPDCDDHYLLRIQTSGDIKTFCNTLFIGKYENNPASLTSPCNRNYRIRGDKASVLIYGDMHAIGGALQRLWFMHQCISPQKATILMNELKQETAAPVRRVGQPH